MTRTLALVALLLVAAAASAQQYKWVDRNGRVQYGDVPPAGVNATPLRAPSARAASAPKADAKAEARKGPLTPAEQEAEFRKRREAAAKESEKQAQAEQEARLKKENCARAQASARNLESGQRIVRTDSKGERYYLDDAEIAKEAARARQLVQDWCS